MLDTPIHNWIGFFIKKDRGIGMKIGFIAVIVILMAGTAYAVKDCVVPTTWRYKITIEIETPEGIKSGSAVREVRAWKNAAKIINPDVAPIEYEVIGEAVIVDLGNGNIIFSLVGANDEVQRAFFGEHSQLENFEKIKALKIGQIEELADINPFVMFENIDDPNTIRSLEPSKLFSILGNRIKFRGTFIEITNSDVTFGKVRQTLGWFDRKPIGLKFFDPQIKDPARYIGKSSFIREDNK